MWAQHAPMLGAHVLVKNGGASVWEYPVHALCRKYYLR